MKRKLLWAALCVVGALGFKANAQTASAVGEGTFFLYNVGSDSYLTGGNNWGTRASVDAHGLDCVLTASGTDYYICTGNNLYLGKDGYVDKATTNANYTAWTFAAVDGLENTYTLQIAGGGNYLVYDGSGTTCSVVADAPATNNGYWKLISKEALLTAANLESATEAAPVDVTFLVDGANFVRLVDGYAANPNAKTDEVSGPWTYTINQNNFTLSGPQGEWNANTGCEMFNNKFDVRQTITVPNGFYYVTCDGFDASGNSRLYGNTVEAAFTNTSANDKNFADVLAAINEFAEGAKTGIITVKDGNLTIGVKRTISGGWTVVDNIRLYCVGTYNPYKAYKNALDAANAIDQEQPMLGTALSALQSALSTYGSLTESSDATDLENAVDPLNTATSDAATSIAAYAKAATALAGMKNVIDGTNVYTSTAYDAYNDVYETAKNAYDARTLSNADAEVIVNPNAVTGWHAANIVDNFLMSAWDGGYDFSDNNWKPYYINTWSTEGNGDGSNFIVPFFEDHKDAAGTTSLDAKTMTATIEGLTADDNYKVSAWVRVCYTTVANPITLQVGDGTEVDVTTGDQIGSSKLYHKTFTAYGKVNDEGKLLIKFNIPASSGVSWLSFKDVNYEKVNLDFSALNGAIAAAEAVNGKISGGVSDLATAIATAKGVLTSATTQDEVDAAVSPLTAATTAAEAVIAARLKLAGTAKKAAALKSYIDEDIDAEITEAETYAAAADATAAEANTKTDALNAHFAAWTTVDIANGNFDSGVIYSSTGTVNDGVTKKVSSNGEAYEFAGWTYSTTATEWVYSATAPYGSGSTVNSSTVPATDMYGETAGAAAFLNAGWGSQIRYNQDIASLPAGKYVFYYEGINTNSGQKWTGDYTGINNLPANSLEGSSNTYVYGDKDETKPTEWTAYALPFTLVTDVTDAKLQFGYQGGGSGKGSGTAPKMWFDNVTIYRIGNVGVTIDEGVAYDNTKAGKADVTLNRTIKAGLNTIVLPFALTQTEVEAAFGTGSKVYVVSAYDSDNAVITFAESTEGIVANKPCVLEVAADGTAPYTFTDRTLEAGTPTASVTGLDFVGTYAASEDVAEGNYVLYDGKLYSVGSTRTVKATNTRAYFKVAGAGAKVISIVFEGEDGEATAIAGIKSGAEENGAVYNVAGQRVGAGYKGIVIKNGKKFLQK